MNIVFKILVLVLLSIAGFLLVPLTINLLIWAELLNSTSVGSEFLPGMLQKSSFIWIGSILIGAISLFIQQSWRIILLLCPLLIPSLFIVLYTMMQL